jgi:sulfur carrier protein ThiS
MRVRLRNPDREVTVDGPRRVRELLAELDIDPDTVLVIRDRTLLTREEHVFADDRLEIRSVISGGEEPG